MSKINYYASKVIPDQYENIDYTKKFDENPPLISNTENYYVKHVVDAQYRKLDNHDRFANQPINNINVGHRATDNKFTDIAVKSAQILGVGITNVMQYIYKHPNKEVFNDQRELVDKINYCDDPDYLLSTKFGLPIMDRWVMLSDKEVNLKSDNKLLLEVCFITTNRSNNIIKTPILGMEDTTFKERVTTGDFNIKLQGVLYSQDMFKLPYADVDKLMKLIRYGFCYVDSPYLRYLIGNNIDWKGELCIESYDINPSQEHQNAVGFNLECVSDINKITIF